MEVIINVKSLSYVGPGVTAISLSGRFNLINMNRKSVYIVNSMAIFPSIISDFKILMT